MSLIRCPECKRKISDKATTCPKCGCPIDGTMDIVPVRNSHIIRIIPLVIGIVCALAFASSLIYYYANNPREEIVEDYKYPLFEDSSLNITDPYGLSNEHYIIGKNINDVLEGFTIGEDYFVTENEYYCSYTFNKEIPYIVERTAKLILYTNSEDNYINRIEYKFRVDSDPDSYTDTVVLAKIKQALTDYYDIDPSYNCINGDYEIITLTKDEFTDLLRNNYKSLYTISWESEIGKVYLDIANVYAERDNDWSVAFTK